jgi:bifunctional non-homologous end joining protein LigD
MSRRSSAPARPVTLSSLDKQYFPSGFTKGEMIRYYVDVAEYILPHLRDRPVTLIRFPEGVRGESFYEKNAPAHTPGWITTHPVPRHRQEGHINYILVNNVETLAWCANLGAIEFHPFLHRARGLDTPTHIAFDLDPGEGADLLTCVEVAFLLRDVFAGLELEAWPKVSGSKGLQLYVPLNSGASYAATQPFAKSVAELLEREHPDLVVSAMAKQLRRGKVLIDWSQNSASKTTVCAYAMRAKRDEPFISMPVTWAELNAARKSGDPGKLYFPPAEAIKRVQRRGDLFAPVLTRRQKLPEAFLQLEPSRRPRAAAASSRTRPAAEAGGKKSKAPPRKQRALAPYQAKRDFTRTAEPAGGAVAASGSATELRFVIQKHDATRLHYDFRLEMDGTLKSWAVPKGPPYELGVKRAAIEVEDHPLEYMNFEGTIPKGQYGGGTVMVWDIGTYELLGGSHGKGDLKLLLHGRKLKGEWHIFRIKSEESKPVWLLAKSKVPARPISARQDDRSVLSGRSMARIAADNDAQWQSNRADEAVREPRQPRAAPPQPPRAPRTPKRRAPARRRVSTKR